MRNGGLKYKNKTQNVLNYNHSLNLLDWELPKGYMFYILYMADTTQWLLIRLKAHRTRGILNSQSSKTNLWTVVTSKQVICASSHKVKITFEKHNVTNPKVAPTTSNPLFRGPFLPAHRILWKVEFLSSLACSQTNCKRHHFPIVKVKRIYKVHCYSYINRSPEQI